VGKRRRRGCKPLYIQEWGVCVSRGVRGMDAISIEWYSFDERMKKITLAL